MQKDFEAEQQRQKNKEEEVSLMIIKTIYFCVNTQVALQKIQFKSTANTKLILLTN